MPSCFVIQPFDSGKFDKRFEELYSPAITAAGLEPYRVDRDPGVDVPIDAIEDGIRAAAVCLADITTDNPNVWYERGFAFASDRPVVMVCSKERPNQKYPFDIQHRAIIPYGADSPSDFDALKTSLTARLKAVVTKGEAMRQIEEKEQVSTIEGLTQPELYVLAETAGSIFTPQSGISVFVVRREVESVLTGVGVALGLRRLMARGFAEIRKQEEENEQPYDALFLTDTAWRWIDSHEELFVIRRPPKNPRQKTLPPGPITDDDIPF
jgi:hypothetical protein